ncbi:hypothetical protein GH714_024030 [Hevea brasiliensis]|uniref:Kinesin motor domain-containing protein n=1 Tax=Hevea brasiliensis TaxID=3981 RepID=A0A6A6LG21_HEVBR|nr:hypothetical protein GH714_024030 [Hevea brasiliensis]
MESSLDFPGRCHWNLTCWICRPPTIYTDVKVVPEHEKQVRNVHIKSGRRNCTNEAKEKSLDRKRKEALNKILDIKEDVFVEVEPILRSALDGYNVCILAYGQTGTGKTFTMDGTNDQPGIIPRALEELYCQACLDNSSSITFSMSMLEVYMGNLRDLLAPKAASRTYEAVTRCNLNIQTDPRGLVEIEGLTEVKIPNLAKAKWWYTKGRRARSTSWTNVNETSSRSHCLTRINISRHGDNLKAKAEVSKLWMVDLGGSERLLKTGATGQTLDEGRAINLSLSALGDVIAALRRKRGHVPYRNSKLTQILKDSLGDSSKVLMLVHVSPCEDDVGETVCSLSFANRARAIEINGELPEEMIKLRQKRILELEEEMREAEEECQNDRNQIQKAEFLLSENKKLLLTNYQLPEDKEKTPVSDKEESMTVNGSPLITENGDRSSLPRFMTSTVASRQRQNAAEKEIARKARSLRPVARSSVQFFGSQSLSCSDLRLKPILRDSKNKSRFGETKTILRKSFKCNSSDLKTPVLPGSKMVTSSDPNLRTTLSRHRRRMSDLI